MDAYAKYLAITTSLRNAQCDMELVSTLTLANGTTQEIVHARRAVCKKASRKRNVSILEFADVDRAALDKVFPFEIFSVADFPAIFIDHVGRRVPQGVGTVVKMPLTWITKSGGTWKYAGPKNATNTLLTVYRGTQAGQGSVVPASEYTTGTATGASTGVIVDTVNFTREQIDFQGRPYVMEADYLLSGTRTPSAEAKRLLGLYGITVDATTFDAASAADTAAGYLIDALYGGDTNGRTGAAIIEDLLRVARGWISLTTTGAWTIIQDVAKASTLQCDSAADQIEIGEYGDGDIQKTVAMSYRPRASNAEDYTAKLSRTTTGQTGELQIKNPYIRDHGVADRLLCYWQKRLNTLRVAQASLHAVQIGNGDVITITDSVAWNGAKDFIATGITRPADKNDLTLREYDAAVYAYTAGTLPADATNTYSPDYSFTAPLAPSGLSVVSQGIALDNDGKATAYALIRVTTPPAVNWARIQALITDTTTNEIYQAQLILNAGNYEATISGLRPNRAHNVKAWAVNATNVDGAVTATVAFTSANYTTAPAAPTGVAIAQPTARALRVSWAANTGTNIKEYIVFRSQGTFAEYRRTFANFIDDTNVVIANAYDYKIRAVDRSLNESADSAVVGAAVATWIGDTDINAQGVGGGSIANAAINRARQSTSTSTFSYTINNGTGVDVLLAEYVYALDQRCSLEIKQICHTASKTWSETGRTAFGYKNDSGSNGTVNGEYRTVAA